MYRFFPGARLTWHHARLASEAMGGRLAVVPNATINTFLHRLRRQTDQLVWLGATDEINKGAWLWTDGSPMRWTNWHPGLPSNVGGNQHYLAQRQEGTWNDGFTNARYSFICEWPE